MPTYPRPLIDRHIDMPREMREYESGIMYVDTGLPSMRIQVTIFGTGQIVISMG